MALNPLDKKTADAVCTVVAIGFIAEQNRIENDYQRTKFQYELPLDQVGQGNVPQSHKTVEKLIERDTGLRIRFTPTESRDNFPFILAKPPVERGMNELEIVVQAYNNTVNFWESMKHFSDKIQDPPKGAYIGGYAHEGNFSVIGPSNLLTYDPLFRTQAVGEDMEKTFDSFAYEIAKADSIVCEAHRRNGAGITYVPAALSTDDRFPPEKLIGCVHGMIHGMLQFPNPPENSVHIEYALGKGTTKVASCLPCSIFMSANGRPASSTHFGRGDNWNFPSPSEQYPEMKEQQERWGLAVIQHFLNGKEMLHNVINQNPALRELVDVDVEDNIPQLFLESLTFQGTFIDKIISTLNAN